MFLYTHTHTTHALSLSLSLSHTHTPTHTRARTRAHTHVHTHTHTLTTHFYKYLFQEVQNMFDVKWYFQIFQIKSRSRMILMLDEWRYIYTKGYDQQKKAYNIFYVNLQNSDVFERCCVCTQNGKASTQLYKSAAFCWCNGEHTYWIHWPWDVKWC